ncbi:MAG: acyltransferase [Bacteroidaceae bacterium]|nr:acyltransferase [Bacteroidaceae bacterium]
MERRGHYNTLTSIAYRVLAFFPKSIAKVLYSLVRNTGGRIPMGIRYICIKRLAESCGQNVAIFPYVTLKHIDRMRFGNNVSIHTMCYFDGLGGIEIGDNVSIAHQSSLVSFDHTYLDSSTPIKYNQVEKGKIVVNDDVWIGCGCRILKGVIIHSRSVIAAGAVVTKDVEAHSLYGGIPAKRIKNIP